MESSPIETTSTPVRLDYATLGVRRRWPLRILIISIVVPSLFGGAYFALLKLNPPRVESPVVECSSHMREIGLAMMMYANEHGGKFPDSLHEILEKEDVESEAFVCPTSNDVRATGPTTRATLDDFDQPGRCSYIYLGSGLTDQCDSRIVVLYEPPTHHHGGMNVLFGDGHTEFFDATKTQAILKMIANHQPMILK